MRNLLFGILVLLGCLSLMAVGQKPRELEKVAFVTVESSKVDFIEGLNAENFKVFDNKVEREIRSVAVGEPFSVGFVFDVSGSVTSWESDLNEAADSIYRFVTSQPVIRESFLIGFNRDVVELADWTTSPDDIARGLRRLPDIQSPAAKNVTSLHEACLKAFQKMDHAKASKKVLIIVSDGIDNSAKPREKEVLNAVKESDALVYFVTLVEAPPTLSPGPAMRTYSLADLQGQAFVNNMTRISGGKQYLAYSSVPRKVPADKDYKVEQRISMAFDKLKNELRTQYSLRYETSNSTPGDKKTKLEMRLLLAEPAKKNKGDLTLRFSRK
jgi:VWFA-related protein